MKGEARLEIRSSRGQSLVEVAIMLPLLLMVVLNVVNLAYFLLVAIDLEGTARSAGIYSVEGSATPYASQLGTSGPGGANCSAVGNLSVAYVAQQDMCGALANPTGSSTTITVCSLVNGIASGAGTTSQIASCQSCTGSAACKSATANEPADPEAPNFVLNQVSISYTFNPLIPGQIFNIPLRAFSGICQSTGTCTFTRSALMRAMN